MPIKPSRKAIDAAIGAVKPTDRVLSWELMRDRLQAAYDIDFDTTSSESWQKQAEIQADSLRRAQALVEELLPLRAELQANGYLLTSAQTAARVLQHDVHRLQAELQAANKVIDRLADDYTKMEQQLQAANEEIAAYMTLHATAVPSAVLTLRQQLATAQAEIERLKNFQFAGGNTIFTEEQLKRMRQVP